MQASGWAVLFYAIMVMILIGIFGLETMMSGVILPITIAYILIWFGGMCLVDWIYATRRKR